MNLKAIVIILALAGCEYQSQDAVADCDPSFAVLPVLAQPPDVVEVAVNCAEIVLASPGQEPHVLDHTYIQLEGSSDTLVVVLPFGDVLDVLDNCGVIEMAP